MSLSKNFKQKVSFLKGINWCKFFYLSIQLTKNHFKIGFYFIKFTIMSLILDFFLIYTVFAFNDLIQSEITKKFRFLCTIIEWINNECIHINTKIFFRPLFAIISSVWLHLLKIQYGYSRSILNNRLCFFGPVLQRIEC